VRVVAVLVASCGLLAACGSGSDTGAGAPPPVDGRIAFMQAVGMHAPVYVMPADGGRAPAAAGPTGRIVWGLSWSPNGTRIALITSGSTAARRVEVLGVESGGSRVIRGPPRPYSPVGPSWYQLAWAPRGGRIALLLGDPGDKRRTRVVVIYLNGTIAARARAPDIAQQSPIAWSPDGRQLAYGTRHRAAIGVISPASGRHRNIPLPVAGSAPSWSPSGAWLAVATRRGIARVRPSGAGFRLLTRSEHKDRTPTWSPDGRWVAYAHRSGVCNRPEGTCRQDVYRVPAGGGAAELVRRTPALIETAPVWGP
jgi:Tol biopolymer transport system component